MECVSINLFNLEIIDGSLVLPAFCVYFSVVTMFGRGPAAFVVIMLLDAPDGCCCILYGAAYYRLIMRFRRPQL
jgi:hypothetical protein